MSKLVIETVLDELRTCIYIPVVNLLSRLSDIKWLITDEVMT